MQFGQLARLAQKRQTMILTSKGETSIGLIRGSMDAGGMSLESSRESQMSNEQLYDISKEAKEPGLYTPSLGFVKIKDINRKRYLYACFVFMLVFL